MADDQRILLDALRTVLEREEHIDIVALCDNGQSAVERCAVLRPHVALLDISMPKLNGIEATRQIVKHDPNCRVIALTMSADRVTLKRVLEAGGAGYVLKECMVSEVIEAIHSVAAGKTFISHAISSELVALAIHPGEGAASKIQELSPREREVLQRLAEGESTKEIASELGVSDKTIESHRGNIMRKTGIHSIAELTKFAIREGLTSLN